LHTDSPVDGSWLHPYPDGERLAELLVEPRYQLVDVPIVWFIERAVDGSVPAPAAPVIPATGERDLLAWLECTNVRTGIGVAVVRRPDDAVLIQQAQLLDIGSDVALARPVRRVLDLYSEIYRLAGEDLGRTGRGGHRDLLVGAGGARASSRQGERRRRRPRRGR